MEGNGTTYNPDLAKSTLEPEEIKEEKEFDRATKDALIERIDKSQAKSKAESDKTYLSRRFGSGARFGGVGSSGFGDMAKAIKETSKTSTDIDTPEEKARELEDEALKNRYEQIGKDITALAQRVDAEGDPDMAKQFYGLLASFMDGNKAALVKFSTAKRQEALDAMQAFRQSTIDSTLDDYFLANGQLNMVGIENRAANRVKKTETSSKALDELKRQGAGSFDLEEIPRRDRAVLANVITTTVADAFKNIFGMVQGGTTQIATATTDNASVRGYEEAAAMLSEDVARSQSRKDKVAMVNFELQQKYNGKMIEALSEFEQRAELNERAYQSQRLQQINLEYGRAFLVLGMKQQSLRTEAELQTSMEATKNREKEVNAGFINAQKIANKQALARAYTSLVARDRAKSLERSKKLTGLYQTVKNSTNFDAVMPLTPYADANVIRMSQVSDETLAGGNGVRGAGTSLGSTVLSRVKEMVADGMPHKDAVRAIQNIILMGQNNMLPRNLTNEALRQLGTTLIQPSTDIQAIVSGSPLIKNNFVKTDNSTAIFMNNTIITVLANGSANYMKQTKKGKGSIDGLLVYTFGE